MARRAKELKCAVCGKPVPARASNPDHPFCSERCRLIDLGNWLGGTYRIPGRPLSPGEGPAPSDGDDGKGPTVH